MDVLTQIRKPVEREMKDFESLFGITLQHQNPLLMIALRHVLSRKGKLMKEDDQFPPSGCGNRLLGRVACCREFGDVAYGQSGA